MYISIFPRHTPSYCKINLQNNHTSGDRYIGDHVVADTLTFHVHAALTYPMLPLITTVGVSNPVNL